MSHATRKRLACPHCRTALRFSPEDHDRPSAAHGTRVSAFSCPECDADLRYEPGDDGTGRVVMAHRPEPLPIARSTVTSSLNGRRAKLIAIAALASVATPVLLVSFGLLRSFDPNHASVLNEQDSVNGATSADSVEFDAAPANDNPAEGVPVVDSSETVVDSSETNPNHDDAGTAIGPDVIQSDTFPATRRLAETTADSLSESISRDLSPNDSITTPLQRLADSLRPQTAAIETADGVERAVPGRSVAEPDGNVVQASGTNSGQATGETVESVNPLDLLAIPKDDRRSSSRRRSEATSDDVASSDTPSEPRSVSVVRPDPKGLLEKRLAQPLAEFQQTDAVPLRQVIGVVGELAAVRIDTAGLSVAQLDAPVTLRLTDTTAGAVLQTALARIEAAMEVRDDHIRIVPPAP